MKNPYDINIYIFSMDRIFNIEIPAAQNPPDSAPCQEEELADSTTLQLKSRLSRIFLFAT
jgi:hypothetical protein